jgi:hypothetical protein
VRRIARHLGGARSREGARPLDLAGATIQDRGAAGSIARSACAAPLTLTRRRVVFCDTSPYRETLAAARDDRTYGIVALAPSLSKRLIARDVLPTATCTAGIVTDCRLAITRPEEGVGPWVALMPVAGARVVTEVQALGRLAGVHAVQLASGGVGGSEGAVVLALEGSDATVKRAFALAQSVTGEPPIGTPHRLPPVQAVFN